VNSDEAVTRSLDALARAHEATAVYRGTLDNSDPATIALIGIGYALLAQQLAEEEGLGMRRDK
jgi:hypothetical protein